MVDRWALVVTGQSPESVEPAETALDHPAARQQREASLCFGRFDDMQFNAFVTRVLRRGVQV